MVSCERGHGGHALTDQQPSNESAVHLYTSYCTREQNRSRGKCKQTNKTKRIIKKKILGRIGCYIDFELSNHCSFSHCRIYLHFFHWPEETQQEKMVAFLFTMLSTFKSSDQRFKGKQIKLLERA